MMHRTTCALLAAISFAGISQADEVVLSNGDHITGTIGNIAGGKMKFTSPSLGELTIDMVNVTTYTTDAPATVQLQDRTFVKGKVTAADATETSVEGHEKIAAAQIKQINPAPQKWTGALVVNGMLARGNTHSEQLGVALDAVLRRDTETLNDRFTIGAGYSYGKERDSDGSDNTTTDNFFALGKYDLFFDPKLYGYGNIRADHDRIANLNYRITPGVGLGYQFKETPTLNVSGEAGISYVYEDYEPGGTDEHIAFRLAGHVDKKLNDFITLFANGEILPAFEDPGDYNANADAGIRAKMIGTLFAEFKVEYKRDSTPAPDSEKNDIRYLLGIGWQF